MAKKINSRKLHSELKSAGILIRGCDSNGVVWNIYGEQIQDQDEVIAIIKLHDPADDDFDTILQKKYSNAGVSTLGMVLALWKKVMVSDSTDADALQSLMDGIDASIN